MVIVRKVFNEKLRIVLLENSRKESIEKEKDGRKIRKF